MKLKIIFAWYDCWIGMYYDLKNDALYVFPIPFVGIYWKLLDRHYKYFIGDGIAFGEQGHYYKWKNPFTRNLWCEVSNNFNFVEVPFDRWYYNKGIKMSLWSNILRSLWAAQPFTYLWRMFRETLIWSVLQLLAYILFGVVVGMAIKSFLS